MDRDETEQNEAAQDYRNDDLNQSPDFDPTDPEPIPQNDFDQTWGALPFRPSPPAGGAPASAHTSLPSAAPTIPPTRSLPHATPHPPAPTGPHGPERPLDALLILPSWRPRGG
jgi:hypothetical protein